MALFDPRISQTVQPISTKLKNYNYFPKTTRHAWPHVAASTWVVWANTQFATVSFFPCLFLVSSARTQVAPLNLSRLKSACKRSSRHGCAFWGLVDDRSRIGVHKNRNFGAVNRHFKSNLQKKSNRHIFKTMQRIWCGPMKRLRGWSYVIM